MGPGTLGHPSIASYRRLCLLLPYFLPLLPPEGLVPGEEEVSKHLRAWPCHLLYLFHKQLTLGKEEKAGLQVEFESRARVFITTLTDQIQPGPKMSLRSQER